MTFISSITWSWILIVFGRPGVRLQTKSGPCLQGDQPFLGRGDSDWVGWESGFW